MSTTRTRFRFALSLLLVPGCGPLLVPGVVRLEPEAQREVDGMWANMLTPVDRLDRDVLLDAVMSSMLFQLGVERLSMRSEKDLPEGGRVVMTVDFDKSRPPARDTFTIRVLDRRRRLRRAERYTGEEVLARANEQAREREARARAIEAATQPAR